jgi:hypothetical protein
MDAFTQRRISELRIEIAALQKENSTYAQQPFHLRAARYAHDIRRERLEAIKEELMHLNKPFQQGM